LDVYENELNKKLQKDLEDYFQFIIKTMGIENKNLSKVKDNLQELIKNRKQFEQNIKQLENELNLVNDFLQNVDKTIDLINKKNQNFIYEKQSFELDINSQEVILNSLNKTLKDEHLINCRIDVSQRKFGGTNYLDNIINIDQSLYKERIILITSLENDDETLKAHLCTGTVIPDDMSKIKSFKSNIVLYNNNTCAKNNIKVDLTYSEGLKQLKISVQCDIAFKFYFYYTQKINDSQIYDKIDRHFKNIIINNKQRCLEIENLITIKFK